MSEALVSDTATRVIMAQPDAAVELTRHQLGLTSPEAELLPALTKGRALWHLGAKDVALVRHMLPPEVLELTDTDQRMTGRGNGFMNSEAPNASNPRMDRP